MNSNQLAFFIGLFGSVHCIGMCGPLAFSIPFTGRSRWLLVWDKLIYQLGRVISYSLLGLIIGLIGRQLWLFGLQQIISLLSGMLIMFAACGRLLKIRISVGKSAFSLSATVNNMLVKAVNHKAGHLFIGVLNGFLPCGFVYMALVGAMNSSSVASSIQYMFWFGLGTLPLMLAATLGAGIITGGVRNRMNKIVPYFMLCLGVWFVLRGMSLDIPYVSPAKINSPAVCR